MLPLNKLIDLARANYMYSLSNNQLPTVFRSYCSRPSHRYETRFAKNNFALAKSTSKLSETSIKVFGPRMWSNIPSDAKTLPFRKTFSKHMKHIYIQELPSEKRTKEIKPKPEAPKLDLAQIFESNDDASFHGFDIVMNNPRVN